MKNEQDLSPFVLKATREEYKNPWISVREDKVTRPGGGDGLFGIVTMKPGSSVLALTEEGDVFLTKEYKYGIARSSLEVVSGALDEDEQPIDAAKRELREELGLEADTWIDCGKIDPFTTVVNSPNYMFLCFGMRQSAQQLDPGEVLSFHRVKFSRAVDMALNGEITHGASCVLLLKAERMLRERGIKIR